VGEDEVDAVSIAGMGGGTIADILSAAPWTKDGKCLLLQPMTALRDLREYLWRSGYRIEREHIVREGKRLYSVMEAVGGKMPPLSLAELWAGQQSDDPLRAAWLEHVSYKARKALAGQRASRCPDEAELERLERVLAGLDDMKKDLKPIF